MEIFFESFDWGWFICDTFNFGYFSRLRMSKSIQLRNVNTLLNTILVHQKKTLSDETALFLLKNKKIISIKTHVFLIPIATTLTNAKGDYSLG